ncbi:helix-turn-helix domain-containing protein [Reichenbachiella versicolor]|uniref:helix-turn-helix domain-containing protein n=1 Tax=Reichenbachiella versicolor TaxID=1821036 RepID=UPI000D6E02B9|nr:helix-turn-helix transcriptional regulator [Reichenbachiella versicolor]
MKMRVGDKLLEIRKEKNMSQSEFSHLVDIPSSTYSRVETNQSSLEIDKVIEIANKLDVPIQEFLPETINISNTDNENQSIGAFFGNQTHHHYYYGSDTDILKEKDKEIQMLKGKLAILEEKLQGK